MNTPANNIDVRDAAFWENEWTRAGQSLFLMKSQAENPSAWFDFYTGISGCYGKVWKSAAHIGDLAVGALVDDGVVQKGARVLAISACSLRLRKGSKRELITP